MHEPPLTEAALVERIALGEHTRQQFKRTFHNPDALAAELAAFANSGGGTLLIGVDDDGRIAGLDAPELRRLNQMLSNASSQHVRPPIHPLTENVKTEAGLVMVVTVPNGLAKPYLDHQGRIWVKQGADKRHVTAREELQRMFQRAGLVLADVVPVAGTTSADLDEPAFRRYLDKHYAVDTTQAGLALDALLQNLGLGDGLELNLSGLMLFGRNPLRWCPAFVIKAVAFPGTRITDTRYLDSQDISGTLPQQYTEALAFIKRNLHRVQGDPRPASWKCPKSPCRSCWSTHWCTATTSPARPSASSCSPTASTSSARATYPTACASMTSATARPTAATPR